MGFCSSVLHAAILHRDYFFKFNSGEFLLYSYFLVPSHIFSHLINHIVEVRYNVNIQKNDKFKGING